MANTLTSLIPDLYAAMDVVSREIVGMIPGITRDPGVDRAAVGQTVRSFVAPAATIGDITPGVTPPDDGDQTIGNVSLSIQKSKRAPFRWNGEQTLGVNNAGPGAVSIQNQQLQQAYRSLINAMELDLTGLSVGFSRATGTATTQPFGSSDLTDITQLRKILVDNGAPLSDMHVCLDTSAGAKLRALGQLTKANEAGTTDLLRNGILQSLQGMDIRESAQIIRPASGTASGATTNTAGYAIGVTAITMAAAGTGTILAGDVVTFAGDTNKYVVATGLASAAAGGGITLAAPGLRLAIAASATALTVTAVSARNVAYARSAIVLATRLPALPDGGDSAVDRTTVTDPVTGISFELSMYAQYRQMQYELSVAWGANLVKAEHTAILLGG